MARCLLFLLFAFFAPLAGAQQPSAQELEDWFNAPPEPSAADVNEGELVFLTHPPGKPVHHHHNTLTINDQTVASGWATLHQCHDHLDKVPATQIVFREDRVRDLKVTSFKNIGQVSVEGASVQLRGVGSGAKVCIEAKSKVLYRQPDGLYHIANGPFMRRFLDGYYPMHVSMDVIVSTRNLRFVDITPGKQEGFRVSVTPKVVKFDAWFEGRLNTLLRFKAI